MLNNTLEPEGGGAAAALAGGTSDGEARFWPLVEADASHHHDHSPTHHRTPNTRTNATNTAEPVDALPLDKRMWTSVHFSSPSPGSRVFPSAVSDSDRHVYIFGGHDGNSYRNDLIVFDLDERSWVLDVGASGEGPSARDAHAAVLHNERMYVFGGYDSKRYLNDLHSYDLRANTWSSVASSGTPPTARGGHTAVVYHDRMIIFGGCDGWNYFNDCHSFKFLSGRWTALRVTGTAPGARSAPATVVYNKEGSMYIFGGYDGARSLNDLFRFEMQSSEWLQVRTSGTPPTARGGHSAVVQGDAMFVFGGKSGRSPFSDLYRFDFETSLWASVAVDTVTPAPRCAHVCVTRGESLYIFGGYDGRRYFDDCFELSLDESVGSSGSGGFTLAGDLESMVNNEQFSDIAFEVEGRTVHAHKFILFARCEYFRHMFTSGYREASVPSVTLEEVSYDVFIFVLTYLYTGKAPRVTPELALEAMSAADLYRIEPLKRHCANVVTRTMTIQSAPLVLCVAESYREPQLSAAALSFMVLNFNEVVRTEAFGELIATENREIILRFLHEAGTRLFPAGAGGERSSGPEEALVSRQVPGGRV